MAAVEVTISGVIYDKLMRTTRPVVLIGDASLTGLSVGGGPMPPGGQPPDLGIWPSPPEGQAPIVSHPIAPGGPPPQIWPSPGVPTHPIVLPPELPPTLPPPDSRPIDWKTAWTPQTGWVVIGIPTGPTPTPSAT